MKRFHSFLGSFQNGVFIFDKDGTLIDTESLYFEAFNRFLSRYGVRHDRLTHADMMGAPAVTCLDILRARHAEFPQDVAAYVSLQADIDRHILDVRSERGTRAMPGAQAFLDLCRAERIRLGMATSARRENADRDLRNLGWSSYFEAVVTANDVSCHKPAPDIYLEAAKRMGVEPSACVAVEDGIRGVLSAHAAGMRVIFVGDERFGIVAPPEASLTVGSLWELMV